MRGRRENELEEFDEKCAKHEAKLAAWRAQDEEEQEEESWRPEEAEREKELPFEDILADQRRKYSLKQEYAYLIYNDLIQYFVKNWDGTYLRKTLVADDSFDESSRNDEGTSETSERIAESSISQGVSKNTDWQLFAHDERAEIIFINGNSYAGRISRRKMEGQGIYRWRNGSHYEGDFEDNKIQGKGRIEWQDGGWYEGHFRDGYRHGKGTMANKNYNILYIGQWDQGCKHGKGFEKGDSYDGDWIMNKREGEGNYIYPNGSRYVGNWKGGFRHGRGTMTWPNGDVYRGEWKNGEMHGYGEYTWTGFFNNTLSWPQENCYMGDWHEGTRHGKGQITLNSIGGARYSGEWRNDKKHGTGMIIGNNGEVTEGDPLFENDILLPARLMENVPEENNENTANSHDKDGKAINKMELTKAGKILQSRVTTVLKPEQCISLHHYVNRLRVPETLETSASVVSLMPEKCGICENSSCRCLKRSYSQSVHDEKAAPSKISSKSNSNRIKSKSNLKSAKTSSSTLENVSSSAKIEKPKKSETPTHVEKETYWTYDCITMHMPRIRKIYDDYSKIFADVANNCRFSMSRLSLWQLWRDCEVHRKFTSLVQIDNYLAANKSTLMQNAPCPFERIEIWQLIHALLEVSWHLYTKNGELDAAGYPGKLANGLNKFLINDVYPNVGKHAGILCGPERDLVSLYPAYKLYQSIGQSHSARQLLATIFSIRDTLEPEGSLEPATPEEKMPRFSTQGRNSVLVGERLSYLPNPDEFLNPPTPHIVSCEENVPSSTNMEVMCGTHPINGINGMDLEHIFFQQDGATCINTAVSADQGADTSYPLPYMKMLRFSTALFSSTTSPRGARNSLRVLGELGAKGFVEIMSTVCPSIKDPESGAIVQMHYELTFLEFLEILVEAVKQLVLKRKMSKEAARAAESEERVSIAMSARDDETRASVRFSVASKSAKLRKKTRHETLR